MRREVARLALLAALLALCAPLAEAKGGYGGSGYRSTCRAVDTNGDNVVSSQEQSEQCGDGSAWPILALFGAGAVAGLVGLSRLRPAGLRVGQRGTLNDKEPFTVAASLAYRNEEGDRWKEYLLRFDGGREAWLEIDGSNVAVHRLWRGARATLSPATVDGRAVTVDEAGTMTLERVEGSVPHDERETTVSYADGRLADGQPVSIESDGHGVEVFQSFPAHLHGKGRVVLYGNAAAKWK